jgi:hypothetical protein
VKPSPKYVTTCHWCGKKSRPVTSWTATKWMNAHNREHDEETEDD